MVEQPQPQMRLIPWDQRAAGDIGLVRHQDFVSDLIADFVSELHEDYHGGFVPTHAFIVATDDIIIESGLTWKEDSVAVVNPASEYTNLPVQLWRIERTQEQIDEALSTFQAQYDTIGYGFFNLLGFALEAAMRHLGNPKARNPILHSYVCSQAALLFLRFPSAEKWPLTAELRDCDPIYLLMQCQQHEIKDNP